MLGSNTSLLDAFKEANDVLLGAVQGIADLIIRPGLVNVDFADVRTVMSEMGAAMMGTVRPVVKVGLETRQSAPSTVRSSMTSI
ncbi:MAG: hypothetical protein CM15mP74_01560 [Halieaceae bacterium]|nr:MAG: hypothetical protein CM15mP74_01560 [Halieaceae bacterium]